MTLELARKAIRIALEHTRKTGNICSIAVTDRNGVLVALHRMDGALIPTADIARDKAWTAAVFQCPSSEISRYGDPAAPNSGFNTSNWNDRITSIPGGLPIKDDSGVIGGIGVSGGTPEEDMAVCEATIWALQLESDNKA
ncbi:MAG: heme-binding protein [Dehalococcoidia bacterium]|nr:heme-binding protein [Dehalococcoidia bacterium]